MREANNWFGNLRGRDKSDGPGANSEPAGQTVIGSSSEGVDRDGGSKSAAAPGGPMAGPSLKGQIASIDLLSEEPLSQQPKFSVPEVSRKRLVLPVITILFISFLSIFAFIWATARSLNEEAASRDRQLAHSLLASQRLNLERAAREAATGPTIAKHVLQRLDKAWFHKVLGPRLSGEFGASGSWILSPDGATRAAAIAGRASDEEAQGYFPSGLAALLERLASQPAASPDEVSGYLAHGAAVQLVVATRVRGDARGTGRDAPLLVVSQALDESFLIRGGINFTLGGLTLQPGPVAPGYQGIPLQGEGTGPLAYLVWLAERPGDGLLWPLSPAMGAALIAIGYFLLLFVRGADLFMERQAYLAASLQQEQNLRNLKSRFVSMVSHELRTPLATIRNATEVLERYGERMTVEDRAEETRAIHRSVDSLAKLVDNVLVIGRSDWMTGSGKRRPIDLVELSRQVWSEVVPGYEAQSRILISEEGERRVFYGDVTALRALLSNLFSNAVKYSRGAGEVMLTLIHKPKETTIRVTDFGIGIAAEDMNAIFEPFQRGENAETMTGSGLGLAIAKAAVQAMGGEIKVQSQLGKGTTFEVIFPQDGPGRLGKTTRKKGGKEQ